MTERGDAGVTAVQALTGGLGAHSVIEAVGTQEAMMQVIHVTRPGGHVGFVGVAHEVELPGMELFFLPRSPAWRTGTGPPVPA